MRKTLLLLLLLLTIPLTAQQDGVSVDTAFINNVTADYTDEGIVLNIRGDFPDSCSELGEISQAIDSSGATLSLTIIVESSRPADAICAQVLTSFETSIPLDTSDLDAGTYSMDVNGFLLGITIDPTACPEVQEEMLLFNAQGICFLYPADYSELSAEGFVLLSPERNRAALVLVEIMPEESNLEALAAHFPDSSPARFGAEEALLVEDTEAEMRQAYVIFEGNRYIITMQPIDEALWQSVMNTLYFTSETSAN